MLKSSGFVFLFVLSVSNSQFFYNYEEDRPDEPPTEAQNFDNSPYQYNPPSAVNQQFVQPSNAEPRNDAGNRRTRIRVRSRNYQSDPVDNQPLQETQNVPPEQEIDHRAARQERRQARRRLREFAVEPVLPPRVYAPSVFENIGLGEAPSGVYIPQNSFLNVLRNPSRRAATSFTPSQPTPVVSLNNNAQPLVSYANGRDQTGFFVQPPSVEVSPRARTNVLPVTGPQVEYATPSQTPSLVSNNVPQSVQARSVRTNRQPRPRIRIQPEYAAPPTVDIDSYREFTDEVARENLVPQIPYIPVNNRQNSRPLNRRRTITSYETSTVVPRVYAPSVFEKVSLGEAPSGVYVPEDSLLNVLRNPSSGRHSSPRVSVQEAPQLLPQPPTYSAADVYETDGIAEEEYQPPLPPPPPKRRSSQRSSQAQRTRPQRRRNENEFKESHPVQPSSQRRSQQRNDDFVDYERQAPPARQVTQAQRRPAPAAVPAAAPRTRPQASSSEKESSAFKAAKLAIAELPLDTDGDGIPGEAGVNYPTLHVIPKTAFSCSQQPHNGYYADLETSCQVVHLCQSRGVQDSFLCPNGTIFSQEKFSCQWWYKVNCSDAPKFYVKNDELYKVPEKKERKRN